MASVQSSRHLVKRLGGFMLVTAAVAIALIGVLAWWAVSRIDERALNRQLSSVRIGLQEQMELLPKEQDSSAIWDEAVINSRANNGSWLAENLIEWMSSYYAQERVYLIGPDNHAVRAAANGKSAPLSTYAPEEPAVAPVIARLRAKMSEASKGQTDSTSFITGLGEADFIQLRPNVGALVSVRPVVPSSGAVEQTPGSEFLLLSMQFLDAAFTADIAQKYALEDLAYAEQSSASPGKTSYPVSDAQERTVGYLTWTTDRPGTKLAYDMAPALGLAALLALVGMGYLLSKLQRTSTELHVSEAHARFLAFHDSLTRIPNRALFEDRLERALAGMRRTKSAVAVHYLDLDRFKHVNDTLGHPAGDELVRQVALRLSSTIREVDTVARLGGDEFAVIQVDAGDDQSATTLAERMLKELQVPFDLKGDVVRVGVSIGFALSSDLECTPQDMMRKADLALYQAKENGRGRVQMFVGDMDEVVRERRALERDLRAALQGKSGLSLEYQPLYDAASGKLVGAEALARWAHPEKGNIPPVTFIGIAEERGLIEQLGTYVLRSACEFVAHHDVPWIAVNVSPVQFRDEQFADRVLSVLQETGVSPGRIELEITEGLLLQNSPLVQTALRRLRAAGIRIALDDFGTGYSSISYLLAYGVDKLKIDKSFVDQLGWDEQIGSIVKGIIDLARAMNMRVTAEGVETNLQKQMLVEMGCDELQGYLLSRPLSESRLSESLGNLPRHPELFASTA